MKSMLAFIVAVAGVVQTEAIAADRQPAPADREEQVESSREVKIFGRISIIKIIHRRSGSAKGNPKRGPTMIPVPRDPVSERIEAVKGKK